MNFVACSSICLYNKFKPNKHPTFKAIIFRQKNCQTDHQKANTPIQNEMKKHSVLLVRKYLDRQLFENFQSYFTARAHEQNTRNNGIMLEVPKVKLQVAKSSFRSMGVNIYNNLPIQSPQTDSLLIFKERIKNNFSMREAILNFIYKFVIIYFDWIHINSNVYVTLNCTSCIKISFIIIIIMCCSLILLKLHFIRQQ